MIVFIASALACWVHVRAPEFWKLPLEMSKMLLGPDPC